MRSESVRFRVCYDGKLFTSALVFQRLIDCEARLGLLLDLVQGDAGGKFDQRHSAAGPVNIEYGKIDDHHIDHAGAGQRQRAFVQKLRLVLGGVLHDDHHLLDAADEVHGAAHTLHDLAGDHPVGEIAVLSHLHGAEQGDVDVTAADHGE